MCQLCKTYPYPIVLYPTPTCRDHPLCFAKAASEGKINACLWFLFRHLSARSHSGPANAGHWKVIWQWLYATICSALCWIVPGSLLGGRRWFHKCLSSLGAFSQHGALWKIPCSRHSLTELSFVRFPWWSWLELHQWPGSERPITKCPQALDSFEMGGAHVISSYLCTSLMFLHLAAPLYTKSACRACLLHIPGLPESRSGMKHRHVQFEEAAWYKCCCDTGAALSCQFGGRGGGVVQEEACLDLCNFLTVLSLKAFFSPSQ